MTTNIIINSLERKLNNGEIEIMNFTKGVNIIVGPPNTGKTKWLSMLDYIFGDPGKPEDAFGKEITELYTSVLAKISIGNEEYTIERRWKEHGLRSKILVNEKTIPVDDFSDFLLTKLGIPVLHFPKGNPYSEKSWPELSWRMMLRHIYRQERFYSDLADKQPESEQHAVLTQFLGIAEKIFPQELGEIVNKRKEVFTLKARKDQFQYMFDKITSEIISNTDSSFFATPELLATQINELDEKTNNLLTERQNILESTVNELENNKQISSNDIYLSEKKIVLSTKYNQLDEDKNNTSKRIDELKTLKSSIKDELERLTRTKITGQILKDIKITHCPACNQEISSYKVDETCFLCHRPYSLDSNTKRIEFEIKQLESEIGELDEIIVNLEKEFIGINNTQLNIKEDITTIENNLKVAQNKFSALVGSKISIIDYNRGQIQEQIDNYKRLQTLFNYKDELIQNIQKIDKDIANLETYLDNLSFDINYEKMSSDIEDGMMNYLNLLNKKVTSKWEEGRISLKIDERRFNFLIGNQKWASKLGGTVTIYFLMAYHYSLMNLCKYDNYRYPGLCIIDFPPELADGYSILDKENYLVEPFISLCKSINKPTQFIIAGRAFENIDYDNKISLDKAYKPFI